MDGGVGDVGQLHELVFDRIEAPVGVGIAVHGAVGEELVDRQVVRASLRERDGDRNRLGLALVHGSAS